MKIKMMTVMFCVMATIMLVASSTAFAEKKFSFIASNTLVYDPDGLGTSFSQWKNGIGEYDSPNCKTNYGLLLQKSSSNDTNVAAGVELEGLNGVVVKAGDAFGYDIRKDSPCGGGSPRFNVTYTLPNGTPGFSYVGGCANGTKTLSPQNPSWDRVTFDLQTQAFPVIPVGSVIESVYLLVDEQGTYNLDNIMFRGLYVDSPFSSAGKAPKCNF